MTDKTPEGRKSDTMPLNIKLIRQFLADYMWSKGGDYLTETEEHKHCEEILAKLLRVPKYKDGSGYDFFRFRTKAPHEKSRIEREGK